MTGAARAMRKFHADAAGQTTLEWALLLAGFGLPMIYVFGVFLNALAEHYRMLIFFETLPLP